MSKPALSALLLKTIVITHLPSVDSSVPEAGAASDWLVSLLSEKKPGMTVPSVWWVALYEDKGKRFSIETIRKKIITRARMTHLAD